MACVGQVFAFLAHAGPFWSIYVNFGNFHPRGLVWAILAVFATLGHVDELCPVVGNFGPAVVITFKSNYLTSPHVEFAAELDITGRQKTSKKQKNKKSTFFYVFFKKTKKTPTGVQFF